MTANFELIRVVLLALLLGICIPLVVQAFLTLRAVHKAASSINQKIDETTRAVQGALVSLRPEPARPQGLELVLNALVPAAFAFARTYLATDKGPSTSSNGVREAAQEKEMSS